MGPINLFPAAVRPGLSFLALIVLAAAGAPAQTLSIVSGDGQVAPQNFQLPGPLLVVAKNASGNPVPGITVNWSLSGPGNLVGGDRTVTDSSGQATNGYVGATIFGDT